MIGLAKLAPGPGNVGLVEMPEHAPGHGEIALSVEAAGVCGTDLHIEAGEYAVDPPVVVGHEVCGVVTELGAGVDASWQGVRAVSETFFSTCGHCWACRDGRPNLCAARRSIGTHVDGAFAERLVVPATNLHRVPDGLSPYAAVLSEPLACVCQCMLDPATVAPGERVLVVGPGPMGLLAAQVARLLGGEVMMVGLPRDAPRLAVAAALGFEVLEDVTRVGSVDVAVDVSGAAAGASACLTALRHAGRFVQMGIFGAPVTLPMDLVLLKELEIVTGFAATPRSWRRATGLIERGRIALEELVGEVVALNEWNQAFADLRGGRLLKLVLDPTRATRV